jgi:metal-sulfur cluster biosynthetic enzyme
VTPPFPYDGPELLRGPVAAALQRVVDPELSLSVVDAGLIYGVTLGEVQARVLLTMTSAACPVIDVIVDEVEHELGRALPAGTDIVVDLTWEPPWTPDRMSERAKRFMGW